MYRTTNALLLAALLSSACSQPSYTGNPVTDDGGIITSGNDLSGSPVLGQVEMTTIRDLNADKFPTGTHVQVVGVMQSPVTAGYAVEFNKSCMYELVVVQADPTPTLKDGIVVRYINHNVATTADLGTTAANCQAMGTTHIALGDTVTIKGTLVVTNGIHSIDLGTLGSVVSSGPAQTKPTPVLITADQLPSAPFNSPLVPQFASAYGALVSLQNVVVSESHAFTLTYLVGTAMVNPRTRVSTEYLRLLDSTYMPLGNYTVYKSVTGVVSTDLGGTILPRGTTDLVAQ